MGNCRPASIRFMVSVTRFFPLYWDEQHSISLNSAIYLCTWMVYSLVVRARGLEYGGREVESRSLHLKPETKLREERGLSGCRKGLKTVPLAQALLSLKPAKTTTTYLCTYCRAKYFAREFILGQQAFRFSHKMAPEINFWHFIEMK